jgi:hypothetical protein
MQFNETEVRFLRQEHATRRLKPIHDLREIGCPSHIFQRILEERAKKLGASFDTFRAHAVASGTAPPHDSLADRIQGSKLF